MAHQHDDVIAEALNRLMDELRELKHALHKVEHQQKGIVTALETLTASVNANTQADGELTVAVNAAIVQLGAASPTDAQLLTLAGQVDANTATTAAQTAALNAALAPATPPTP